MIADQMVEIARSSPHAEVCGFVVTNGQKKAWVVQTKNTHDQPRNNFIIDEEAWSNLADDEEVVGIWHSHVVGTAEPSMVDLSMCEATGLPWHIVTPEGDYRYFEPSGYEAPYTGRAYVFAVHDCYSLAVDWFRREWQIDLPPMPRIRSWWEQGIDLMGQGFGEAGFLQLPEGTSPQVGDVFLCQVRSKVPNHVLIYVGGGKILHHAQDRLSTYEMWDGFWASTMTHHLRHIRAKGSDG